MLIYIFVHQYISSLNFEDIYEELNTLCKVHVHVSFCNHYVCVVAISHVPLILRKHGSNKETH